MSNILYYSKKCKHCKSMIIHLSQSPAKNSVQFVCIDDLITSGTLPNYITSVPIIHKTESNTLLKGDHAMEWIRSFDKKEDEGDIGGPGGFGGFGGAFSGLTEEGYSGSLSAGDSYSFLDGAENLTIQPTDTTDSSKSSMKSEKQAVMDSAYDKMMEDRASVGQGVKRS
jgi:hypothetical protein